MPGNIFTVFPEFLQKISKITPQILRNVFKITSYFPFKFPWKLHEISIEMWRKFIQTILILFLRNSFLIFWRFSNIFSIFFHVLLGSAKFLPSFLKTIAIFFRIPKFYQKFRNTNFCVPMLFRSFIKFLRNW